MYSRSRRPLLGRQYLLVVGYVYTNYVCSVRRSNLFIAVRNNYQGINPLEMTPKQLEIALKVKLASTTKRPLLTTVDNLRRHLSLVYHLDAMSPEHNLSI